MILILYCFSLIVLCLIPILIIKLKPTFFYNSYLKQHILIFLTKLIIISMFIYIFISNLSISNTKLFIIVGCFICVIFHFIEGFILQKTIIKNGKS